MTVTMMLMGLLTAGCVPKAKYDQLQQRHRKLKKEVAALEEAQVEVLRELREDLGGLIAREVIEVTVNRQGRIVIGLSSDVLFASGSAQLSDQGKQNLNRIANVLSRQRGRLFQVEGHTDSDPISTEQFPNNWYLGAARAIVVVEHLIEKGMSPRQLSAASYADTQPASRRRFHNQDRRIELILVTDLSQYPGYEQLIEEANNSGD